MKGGVPALKLNVKIAGSFKHVSGVEVANVTEGFALTITETGVGSVELGGLIPLLSVKLLIVIKLEPIFKLEISNGIFSKIGRGDPTTPRT